MYVCLFIQPSLPLSYSEAAGTGIEVEVVDDLDDEVAASLVGFVFLIMSACLIFILWMCPCPYGNHVTPCRPLAKLINLYQNVLERMC